MEYPDNTTWSLTTNKEHNDTGDSDGEHKWEEETISETLWKIFPVIIFVIGFSGNVLNIMVLRRLGVKRQPTMVFILFLSITDSLVLVSGLPRYWIKYTFDYDIRAISNGMCKLGLFMIYSSMQYSSWVLVGVSLERVVKTYFPFKYRIIYSFKSVVIGLCVLIVCVCVINVHFFWTNGINNFTEGDCGSLSEYHFYFDENVFVYIDFVFLSAAPFLIMFVNNILLTRILRRIQKDRASMMHDSVFRRTQRVSLKMTRMLLITSVYFVVATAPISIYFIVDTYYRPKFEEDGNSRATAKMDLAWTIVYLFQFSNYSVNFYLYTACNRRFKEEFRNIICCRKRTTHRPSVYSIPTEQVSSRRQRRRRTSTTEESFSENTQVQDGELLEMGNSTSSLENGHALTANDRRLSENGQVSLSENGHFRSDESRL